MLYFVLALATATAFAVDFETYMNENVSHPALGRPVNIEQAAFQEVQRRPAAVEEESEEKKATANTPKSSSSKGSELN